MLVDILLKAMFLKLLDKKEKGGEQSPPLKLRFNSIEATNL